MNAATGYLEMYSHEQPLQLKFAFLGVDFLPTPADTGRVNGTYEDEDEKPHNILGFKWKCIFSIIRDITRFVYLLHLIFNCSSFFIKIWKWSSLDVVSSVLFQLFSANVCMERII